VVKALKRAGFVQLCQKGSHASLEKRVNDHTWKTVVPMHSEVAKGTLSDILKQCGLTLAEFLEFL
jgi:predicted RNA binding protein YcfA (HicA-like mRNA interferase family)